MAIRGNDYVQSTIWSYSTIQSYVTQSYVKSELDHFNVFDKFSIPQLKLCCTVF